MKRKLFFIIALACCLVLAVGILAACNDSGSSGQQTPGGEDPGTETPGDNPGGEDPGDETVSFTVTFDTQGGSALADITVENGQVIGEFTLPTKQCSRLVGFALDTAGEQMWNVLTDTVSANITLYAIWEDAHTWNEWTDTTPATCTENGERTRECEVCGATESEVIPAAHIWGGWTETIAPGCETEGERSHSCEVCGKTESETIDALGHDYAEEYTVDVKPTCEGVGSESRHCTRCDATTDSRDIAPLGHDYEGAEWHHNNANHWRYCNRCGEESERENHIFDDSGVCECGMIEIAPVSEFRFISLGNNTWRLANYTGNRTNVSIPSTYNNGTVVAISDDAFSGNTAMQTLVVPDTVTSIGARAFSDCVNLTSVNLSKNLTSIGEDAFTGCTQITSATIPAMAAASIDKSVLTTLHVTTGDIEDRAFANCTKLVYITIGDGVKTIGNGAFVNCTGISAISVPDSVTNIGDSAFFGCSGLVEMTLPFVGGSADATTPSSSTLFGYIFGSSSFPGAFETVQLYGTGEGESATYYIPRYLTSVTVNGEILFGAFYGCDRIEKITLTSATDLGDYAFYNNTSLTEITIPDSVLSIGELTFAYCTSLEDINFPQSIKTVDINAMMESAWYDAQPDGVIYIGRAVYDYKGVMPSGTLIELKDDTYSITVEAFYGCTGLTSVIIPDSVTSIGSGAFSGCSSLESITIPFVGGGANATTQFGYIFGTSSYTGGTAVRQYNGSTHMTYYIPSSLRNVTVTGGHILYGAFYNCSMLTSVTIPDSVTSIGSSAFSRCTGLTSITIPDSVTSIGDSAFWGCSSLESITIPFVGASQDGTSNSHFGYIFGAISYSAHDTYVPSSLKKVVITGGTIIGSSAFNGCCGLTSITIPDSVTSIGYHAFYGCNKLVEVYNKSSLGITAGDSENGYVAYYAKNVYTEEGGSWFTDTADGFRFFYDGTDGYLMGYYGEEMAITLPDGFTAYDGTEVAEYAIYDYAFYRCYGLTSVSIGNSVKSIGSYAFYDCYGLTSVSIGNSVTSIGEWAFAYCDGLTSVSIGNSVTSIGGNAFGGCTGLRYNEHDNAYYLGNKTNPYLVLVDIIDTSITSFAINEQTRIIYQSAFYGCSRLTSVSIGNSVTSIGERAFAYCGGLEAVYISDISAWCGISFSDSSANPLSYAHNLYLNGELVADLVIPDSVTSIVEYAFYGCTSLTSVIIPNSVTGIGSNAFYGCSGLTSVIISNSVTGIGSNAFYGCSRLTSVTIGENVTSIGNYAFSGCTGLTSITIPDSVTSIGSGAFSGCSSLESITIPFVGGGANATTQFGYIFGTSSYTGGTAVRQYNGSTHMTYYIPSSLRNVTVTGGNILYGVTSIGDYAFSGCSGLTSVTIGNSVTSIGDHAFNNCSGLTSVTIGNSVTSIGDHAFNNCSDLTSVTFEGSVEEWNAIDKGNSWHDYCPITEVVCSDGTVSV